MIFSILSLTFFQIFPFSNSFAFRVHTDIFLSYEAGGKDTLSLIIDKALHSKYRLCLFNIYSIKLVKLKANAI